MSPFSKITVLVKLIRNDYSTLKSVLRGAFEKVQKKGSQLKAEDFEAMVSSEQKKVLLQARRLDKRSLEVYEEIKRIIEELIKKNETVISENYFLEYKKRDLLLLTDDLEEANHELKSQKVQITTQAKEIKKASEEIMAKNAELEQQKEFIMDQADYLHELNKSITTMHEEVQKQKEEILNKNDELINLNNEKNNLIGIVAHDLKSPLNQIQGLVSLIQMASPDIEGKSPEYLELIRSGAVRMSEMIEKILDVEAIEAQSLNFKPEEVVIAEVLSNIANDYEVLANQKEITIKQAYLNKKLTACVDKEYLTQIFDNLVSNAIKFSQPKTTLTIKLSEFGNRLVCEVRDQGPGLTEEDKSKLFGKYQKLSARPTGNETSTGLGLSIVKRYVEAMEGKIWCESEEGKGASFFVSFKRIKH